MATLATFNYPFVSDDNGKTTEIKIKPFKVSDIYNALSFSNANRNRKFIHSKIENSPFADIIRLCLNYDPNLRPTASEIVQLLNQPDEYLLLKRK